MMLLFVFVVFGLFQVKAAWHSFKAVHLLKHSLNLFPVTHVVMQSLCFPVSGRFVSSVIR